MTDACKKEKLKQREEELKMASYIKEYQKQQKLKASLDKLKGLNIKNPDSLPAEPAKLTKPYVLIKTEPAIKHKKVRLAAKSKPI